MSLETYIAVLHQTSTPTAAGLPVLCPFQPDGTPKPIIDHRGALYHLLESNTSGVYDYAREPQRT